MAFFGLFKSKEKREREQREIRKKELERISMEKKLLIKEIKELLKQNMGVASKMDEFTGISCEIQDLNDWLYDVTTPEDEKEKIKKEIAALKKRRDSIKHIVDAYHERSIKLKVKIKELEAHILSEMKIEDLPKKEQDEVIKEFKELNRLTYYVS